MSCHIVLAFSPSLKFPQDQSQSFRKTAEKSDEMSKEHSTTSYFSSAAEVLIRLIWTRALRSVRISLCLTESKILIISDSLFFSLYYFSSLIV
jgi:hypothetical protein